MPFVSCPAWGSTDIPAPSASPTELNIPSDIAAKLALYAGAHTAILAPRGWQCSGDWGTDAATLSITPPKGSPHANDASITIRFDMEGTGSDRYDIMTIGRTYFPELVSAAAYENFLLDWKRSAHNQLTQAPRYSTDRLIYLSPSAFEYETRAGKSGIAQWVAHKKSPFVQYGIISITGKYFSSDNEDDRIIIFMNVNLPPELSYLTPFILAAARPCMLGEGSTSCPLQNGVVYNQ